MCLAVHADVAPTPKTMSHVRTTHAYGSRSGFESTLDVYTPTTPTPNAPLVVLVVGSAWLGHRSIIYTGTSWWNSAGPLNVCSLGCVCVAIRHRGAFISAPPAFAAIAITAMAFFLLGKAYALGLLSILIVWLLAARGAASHDQMLDDVAEALVWVRTNRAKLTAPGTEPAKRALVGGYSSGGHCAACLLQRPDKLKQWGLPERAAGFDGVLFLSGVFGGRSGVPLPPYLPASLVTKGLARICFGVDGADALPSPVHTPESSPKVPHLLVHCPHEVFGTPLVEPALSHLLCTEAFATALRKCGVPIRLEAVGSDHWNVLSSQALRATLRKALIEDGWPTSVG